MCAAAGLVLGRRDEDGDLAGEDEVHVSSYVVEGKDGVVFLAVLETQFEDDLTQEIGRELL